MSRQFPPGPLADRAEGGEEDFLPGPVTAGGGRAMAMAMTALELFGQSVFQNAIDRPVVAGFLQPDLKMPEPDETGL